jgi:hypothetical protein
LGQHLSQQVRTGSELVPGNSDKVIGQPEKADRHGDSILIVRLRNQEILGHENKSQQNNKKIVVIETVIAAMP